MIVKELITRLGYDIDDQDLRKYDKQSSGLASTLGGLATAAAAAGIAIAGMLTGQLLRGVFETNVEFERLFAMLKTAEGGTAGADKAFARLENFAATTPFQLNEVVRGYVKLKNLGIDPSERAMRSFGNTASATTGDLNQMVEAVADAATNEFDRLKEFGIKASKQGDKVSFTFKGITTTVKANAKDITEYLIGIGETNFSTSMSEQMLTLGGLLSNIRDNVDKFFRTIGKAGVNDALRELLQTFIELQGGSGGVAQSIGEGLAWAIRRVNELIKEGVARWDEIKAAAQNALDQARMLPFILLVEDFIGFLQGKDSVIGELFNAPEVQDFIAFMRQLKDEVLPEFITLIMELGSALKGAVLAVFPELARQGDGSLKVILEGLKVLIVTFLRLARFAIQVFTWILKAAEFMAPAFGFIFDRMFGGVVDLLRFLIAAFQFFFNALVFGWEFSVNQFTALLNLLTGDIDGAIANWTESLKGFTELLGTIGIDISDITGQPSGVAATGTAAVAAASGAGSSGSSGDTTNTASVGNVTVNVNGSTNMGPDEIAKASSQGTLTGLDKVLKDMNRNSAGATT